VLILLPIIAGFFLVLSTVVVIALWRDKPTSASAVLEKNARTSWSTLAPSVVVRTFASGGAIKLDDKVNTTAGRLLVLIFWEAIVWFMLTAFLYFPLVEYAFPHLAVVSPIMLVALKGIGVVLIGLVAFDALGSFTVRILPFTGVVMTNALTRRLHVFGPGLHIKFPWELAAQERVRLEVKSLPIEVTFPTKDGVLVTYKVNIQYSPQLALLPLHLRIIEGQIEDEVGAVVHRILDREISERGSAELNHQESVHQLERLLRGQFAPGSGQEGEIIGCRLGIRMQGISLCAPTFSNQDTVETTALVAEIESHNLSNALSDVLSALATIKKNTN
jgi:hypothetical protein